ncbi:MAG: molybdate ABC transporter substrate-binding protein [Kiritimatiellae bacterium]|nr:molybdate ABC transporter substrate-binding protein [Kiritimatiellia bacterium]
MKKLLSLLFAVALFNTATARAEDLLVFAAVSLSDALNAIGADFTKQSGTPVLFNFQASSALARQIEAGAPADLFFSADEEKMDQLQAKDLIVTSSRISLLSNVLVIVTSGDRTDIRGPDDLTAERVTRIALAQPDSVPAGIYARRYLEHLGLWETLTPKVVPTENVRAALAAVAAGNADAGFVYRTDAMSSSRVRIAYEIPPTDAPSITYPIAIVKDAPNEGAARDFLEYLRSSTANQVFEQHGFKVLPMQEP